MADWSLWKLVVCESSEWVIKPTSTNKSTSTGVFRWPLTIWNSSSFLYLFLVYINSDDVTHTASGYKLKCFDPGKIIASNFALYKKVMCFTIDCVFPLNVLCNHTTPKINLSFRHKTQCMHRQLVNMYISP